MEKGVSFNQLRETLSKDEPERFFKLELAGRIIGIRNRKNISQSELARISGVPQKTISRMENGLSLPNLITFYKLVDALGCRLNIQIEEKSN